MLERRRDSSLPPRVLLPSRGKSVVARPSGRSNPALGQTAAAHTASCHGDTSLASPWKLTLRKTIRNERRHRRRGIVTDTESWNDRKKGRLRVAASVHPALRWGADAPRNDRDDLHGVG